MEHSTLFKNARLGLGDTGILNFKLPLWLYTNRVLGAVLRRNKLKTSTTLSRVTSITSMDTRTSRMICKLK